jgi:hypothetical protein
MADGLQSMGAQKDPSRSAPLNMSTYISGLITQQNPMAGGAVPYIQQKFYSATRYDRLIGGVNCELSVRLSMVRSPGSSVYNSQNFGRINRWCSFKPIVNGIEEIHVMTDTARNVYDATGPNGQLNIWNKSAGSGKTQFQPVGNELFFGNGLDLQKWVLSELIWEASTLYDGAATSDTTLGDFIIDPNGNIQQAVGGFTLLISDVSITDNILTLTLDTSQLADPSGTPTGTPLTTGGNLPAGNNFIRICGVDPTGNVTEAGNESAAVVTTGSASQIDWTWPALSGAVGYRVYTSQTSGAETTYFTTANNSFTQTAIASTAEGTPPTLNSTSVQVPDNLFQMAGVQLTLSGLTVATFLNGQVVTILSILPGGQESNQITAAFTHADYTSASDTGLAVSGTGITGTAQPSWAQTLWAVTQDGGAQWINRSSYVQKWGIATPAAAPTIFQSLAPPLYPAWQPNTTYWRSGFITLGTGALLKLTTSGITGDTAPTFNTTDIGDTTADGTAVWTYEGPRVWTAATDYSKGAYTGLATPGGNFYVFQAQNAGISGSSQTTWTYGAGTQIQDGSIVWVCLGIAADYGSNVQFTPSRNVSSANTILDSNGYLQQVQDGSVWSSGSSPPLWGATAAFTAETLTAPITGFEIDSGEAIIDCNNFFPNPYPGNSTTFAITGLTIGTYLNGSWLMASNTGTVILIEPVSLSDIGATSDNGIATFIEATMWLNIGAYAPVSTTGRYYAYAYKNSVTQHVGSASQQSALILLLGGYNANVQGFGSADPQVDTIVIYQTADGGSILLEADEIANPGGGVPFTYNDVIPDTDLNVLVQAAIGGANNPPPAGFLPSAYHLGRIWGFVGNKLIYSGGPDTLTGSGNEAFPPGNYFNMPEALTKCRSTSIGLLIYSTANAYIETGLGTSASPFIEPPTFQEGIGLLSYDAECVNGSTMYMMTSSNRVVSWDPGAGEVEVGFFIGDQFDADFDPAAAYLTFHEGSSEDMALYVGDGATGWYRMGILGAPESGNVWSTERQIVGGCGAIQSVEVTPGQKMLLIGPNSSGPILQRDYSTYADNGTPYPMNLKIGSLLLCQPGSEAEVEFVTLDSLLIGTRPTVGVLLGELSGYSDSPAFTMLQATARDLPLLPAPQTLYSDRYHMAQNQNQQSCRHMQLMIEWIAEDEANELLTHTVYGTLRPEAQ